MQKKRLTLYLTLLLFNLCSNHSFATNFQTQADGEKGFSKNFKLIPQPQKIDLLDGKGLAYNALRSVMLQGAAQKPVLEGMLKSLPLTTTAGNSALVLNVSDSNQLPDSPEGYVLEINSNQVSINAKDQAGLFYGCQTLLQLLEDARDQQIMIPACRITDYPELAYRAVHLDLKHHLDVGQTYYQLIDRLAQVKVNAIIVEFEDKLRYRKAPLIGASHAISIEEFAAISRYAKERHIEISPLVQGLGHASFILKHEAYKKLRENPASDWAFSPLDPETYDLQFSLYEDAIAATPYGKYLHVGGDEVGDLGMSALSKQSGMKPLELQMHWLNKVCEFARQHNRIPIFWDDMLFKLSGLYQTTYDAELTEEQVKKIWQENEHRLEENINLFPKDCVYMRWNYDTPDILGNHKALDWYKAHQLKAMAATAAQTTWAMLPRNHSNFQPIQAFCKIASDKKLDGILCTSWDDCSPHLETVWRGLYDFAWMSWNYSDMPAAEAHAAFRHRFYAPALSDASFEFEDLMEQALVFWETALVDKGYRENYPQTIDLVALPDPNKPGSWNKTYQQKLTKARQEVGRYDTIQSRLAKVLSLAQRNEYALSLMNQLNELQIYPAKLLLRLEAYDKLKPSAAKQVARQEIQAYVNHFGELRTQFEEVFSKTRMLSNPAGYQLDSNFHHHLANGTNNSDWMYVYEMAMNSELTKWMTALDKSIPTKPNTIRRY